MFTTGRRQAAGGPSRPCRLRHNKHLHPLTSVRVLRTRNRNFAIAAGRCQVWPRITQQSPTTGDAAVIAISSRQREFQLDRLLLSKPPARTHPTILPLYTAPARSVLLKTNQSNSRAPAFGSELSNTEKPISSPISLPLLVAFYYRLCTFIFCSVCPFFVFRS